MIIKHAFRIFLVVSLLGFLTSCDKIEEGKYRENPTSGGGGTDTSDTAAIKKVFLEDFTGHTCGNCPEAADIARKLQDTTFKGRVIVMAVHAGSFSTIDDPSGKYTYDFRSKAGNDLFETFQIPGNPFGLIDRMDFDGSGNHVKPKEDWPTLVDSLIKEPPRVKIKISSAFNSSTRNTEVKTSVELLENLGDSLKLSLYLIEDSIIKYQKDYRKNPPDIPNYVHNHVLRDEITLDYGESISSGVKGTKTEKTHTYNVNSEWVSKHCHVIAIVFRKDNYRILNSEEIELE